MRSMIFVLLAFSTLVSPVFAARFTPLRFQQKPVAWNRDSNENGLEDYLDGIIAETATDKLDRNVDVIVALNRDDKDENLHATFSKFGEVVYIGRYLTFVCVKGVSVSALSKLATVESVAMIEYNWPVEFTTDVSVAAIQVRQSSTYSNSIEAKYSSITGKAVGIAIMDTGVHNRNAAGTAGHVYFPRSRYKAGYDAINDKETDPGDTDGHGTHVASIALGSGGASATYRGVAHEAELIDIDVNTGTSWEVVKGIDKCIAKRSAWNIRVINMSFKSGGDDDGTSTLAQLCNYAVSQGIVIVAATGNDGKKLIPAPASADDVISVGNVDDNGTVDRSDDTLRSTSNYGPRSDDSDGSTLDERKPLVVAPGTSITAASHSSDTGTTSKTGTSMASPHVAGVAALIIQKQPDINPLSVYDVLLRSADAHTSAEWDSKWGYGTVNGYDAIHLLSATYDDEPATAALAVSDDVGFPSKADPSWVSPDLSTKSAPVVGKINQVRCNIKNLGTKDATNVILTVGVYIYGNGNTNKYYSIGQPV